MRALIRERERLDRMIGGKPGGRGFVAAGQMWGVLERYRSRADRHCQVFSVAVFQLSGSRRQVARTARVLAGRARMSDEIGWLEGTSLCVILPDTGPDGAARFATDAAGRVERRCPTPAFTLYTYPAEPASVNGDDAGPGFRPDFDKMGVRQSKKCRKASQSVASGSSDASSEVGLAVARETVSAAPAGAARQQAEALDSWFIRGLPAWKRALDILGALALLVVTFPVMLVSALAVRLSSPGPIIFRQQRAGLGGRPFTIYKFRTMRQGAHGAQRLLRPLSEQDGPAFKLSNDPRVTRVGAILRRTSIDELPQLLNVLKGEMSLVGPRPLPLDESARCTPWQRRRLEVTPGLTCIWQVKGRSRVTFEQWARMDIDYLVRRTLAGDFKLLVQTVPAVLLRKGAR